jgi:hypothetical protein
LTKDSTASSSGLEIGHSILKKLFSELRAAQWFSLVWSFGTCPAKIRTGDIIFIFGGCSMPVIMHRRHDGAYFWTGDVYAHEIMNRGEAMKDLETGFHQEEVIALR